MASRIDEEVRAAIKAIDGEEASAAEKAEMLMEIAMGLQAKPKSPAQLLSAVELYERSLAQCPPEQFLLHARIEARMATALQAIPGNTSEYLERARTSFEAARAIFKDHGTAEETAETEMNLGLVIQTLCGMNKAIITDAISAYQRSLRTFDKKKYPKEFAILQNNLATAFLSMAFTDQRSKMREALAVQSFEEGLTVVNLIDHPTEYAMLQSNLGNALQYSSSSHAVENNLRALEAYGEALKVRTLQTTPLEYANTISNKANCLLSLPDDPEHPENGNAENLASAIALYEEAHGIFLANNVSENADMVRGILLDIRREQTNDPGGKSRGNGEARPV
ncbi:MAG: hypothetical protein JKY32_03550 [Rhizobiales bacterium]|nr:hypothetical protein [Hyphomicrobiales bacterium]